MALEYLYETANKIFYRDFFMETEVILIRDKKFPEEIMISAESVAKILGFRSVEDMLGNDKILDCINDHMKRTGTLFPIKKMEF